MKPKEYQEMFPGAPIISEEFHQILRDKHTRRIQKYKAMKKSQRKWEEKDLANRYNHSETPTKESFFSLEERIKYLKNKLFSGVKGNEYRNTAKELGRAEQVRDSLFLQLWGG